MPWKWHRREATWGLTDTPESSSFSFDGTSQTNKPGVPMPFCQYFGSGCFSRFILLVCMNCCCFCWWHCSVCWGSPESLSCYQVDTLYLVIQCQSIAKNSCLLSCSSEQRKGAHRSTSSCPPLPSIPRVNSLSSFSNGFLIWKWRHTDTERYWGSLWKWWALRNYSRVPHVPLNQYLM